MKGIRSVFRKRKDFQETANATLRKKFPRLFWIIVVASWLVVPIGIAVVLLRRKKKARRLLIEGEVVHDVTDRDFHEAVLSKGNRS